MKAEDNELRKQELIGMMDDANESKQGGSEFVFCHEYIVDWNRTRAAKEAGFKDAKRRASQLLKKPYIQEYIKLIQEDIAEEAGVSKIGLLKQLKRIAESSVGDIYDNWFELADFKILKRDHPEVLPLIKKITPYVQSNKMTGELIRHVSVEFYDKLEAIKMINKMQGYDVPEKLEVDVNMEQPMFGHQFQPKLAEEDK